VALLIHSERKRAVRGSAVLDRVARWQWALGTVPEILMGQPNMLETIARYTGDPNGVLALAFPQGELVRLDALAQALGDASAWAADCVDWAICSLPPLWPPGQLCRDRMDRPAR
jgi:hypothetical protein